LPDRAGSGVLGNNIFGWYVEALSKYADFFGRARRKEYRSFTLIYIVIFVVIEIACGFPLSLRRSTSHDFPSGARVIEWIYLLAMFLPSLGVAVRRLHDVDKSGWYLLWNLLPIVRPILLLVAYATEGQRWPNQYGPDPKGSVRSR
jgi:uncharacterized membrane protein YhaH (DUF805 family)